MLLKITATFKQILDTVKVVFRNRSFVIHWISFAAVFGSTNAFGVFLNQVLKLPMVENEVAVEDSYDWIISLITCAWVSYNIQYVIHSKRDILGNSSFREFNFFLILLFNLLNFILMIF